MKIKILAPLLITVVPVLHAATFAEVTTEGDTIGTTYLVDGNAGTGGNDYNTSNGPPESGNFDRTFSIAAPGGGGIDVSITGLAFGLPGGTTNTDGNVITATITYLGADGVAGGADDVAFGSTTATLTDFATNGAGRYEWLFDTPLIGNIDGAGSKFRVRLESLEADNGGNTYNMRFKTTSGGSATAVKMDVAGTSTSNGFVDGDIDGIHDGFETNTGTFISITNTGTNPLDDDSDNDGLLDGVETNTGAFVNASNTGTNPLNRDTDNDSLSDKIETDLGLDPFTNADFDEDLFSDRLEVLFYGSDPKLGTSFPGDGTAPAVGSLTPILDAGVTNLAAADLTPTLGTAIINEATTGGNVDANFTSGVTNFVLNYSNAFPAAGSNVSITGFAWPVIGVAANASGDLLLEFYDPGADGIVDGIDQDTLVGTATGTLTVTGSTTIMYWNFDTPINFTSEGTGLMVKIQSTESLRIKAQNNFATGEWHRNDGLGTFGSIQASRFSIGGTAVAPAVPEILTITRIGTSTSLTWTLNGAAAVDLERSTDLGDLDPWTKVLTNTTTTSYMETSSDTEAFFRLITSP